MKSYSVFNILLIAVMDLVFLFNKHRDDTALTLSGSGSVEQFSKVTSIHVVIRLVCTIFNFH